METLTHPKLQDNAMKELYEASLKGCVKTLKTLIQRDPLILSRVSLYPFTETPLHIASLLGHLEFCQILLDNAPSFATDVNSEGRCPLHLASAKGHTQIVKALLLINTEMCLVRDKDDMLPLHFAAMRGHVEVIKELIIAKPESIREMTENDDGSVLHLCVRYNHLEALKFLVESVRGDHQFLLAKDKEDNTVLHLAVKGRQIKIIKCLLSLSEMSTAINTLNRAGFTAMDMLKHCPIDSCSLTMEHILAEVVKRSANEPASSKLQTAVSQSIAIVFVPQESLTPSNSGPPPQSSQPSPSNNDPPPQASPPSPSNNDPPQHAQFPLPSNTDPQQPSHPSPNYDPHPQQSSQSSPSNSPHPQQPSPPSSSNGPLQHGVTTPNITNNERSRWNRLESFCRTYLLSQSNWIDKKTREQLMVAATVIATMTFQSVISPPGGVWQSDTTSDGHACTDFGFCEAGTAVVGYAWSPDFLKFVFLNSASFFSSLCVLLVLISGFPLDNKVIMWILATLMIVAASCMLLTYMWALGLVSPNHIYYRIRKLGYLLVGTWAILLALVGLIQTSRIVFWARSRRKSSTTNAPPSTPTSPTRSNA